MLVVIISIVAFDSLGIKGSLYKDVSIETFDPQVKKLRNKEVAYLKITRKNQGVEGSTRAIEAM